MARFLCHLKRRTFSLLPIQLVPYCQYTLTSIIGALLLGLDSRQQGQQGFQGAVLGVDPDSLVSPWLVACWLVVVLTLPKPDTTLRSCPRKPVYCLLRVSSAICFKKFPSDEKIHFNLFPLSCQIPPFFNKFFLA